MLAKYNEDDLGANPQTLCDWVKNFRIKKIQMKRKFRGDLRVSAMLSTALLSAEHELRRKQHERFNRWVEMQATLAVTKKNPLVDNGEQRNYDDESSVSDGYMKNSNVVVDKMVAREHEKRDEITNLWKYELSGLDEFMRNISSSNRNNTYNNRNNNSTCSNTNNGHAIQVAS